MRRVLSIDGGGIKGVYSAAFLSAIERSNNVEVADYFDLIVGTSTGGIIAIALGLGFSAANILAFYEKYGGAIFPRNRFPLLRALIGPRYSAAPLREALQQTFGDRRLGESRTRLVIPGSNLETGDVLLRKTAHDARFTVDYKLTAVEVALGTASPPTYLQEHYGSVGPAMVDGGLWANNPIGVAVVEAIDVMSGGRHQKGIVQYSTRIVDLFMSTQSSAAVGTAAVLLGHDHIQRYTTVVSRRRFDLDDAKGIPDLRGLGEEAARQALPDINGRFLTEPAEAFIPLRSI
jgi:predicted acylesterase/phospholipase RssA